MRQLRLLLVLTIFFVAGCDPSQSNSGQPVVTAKAAPLGSDLPIQPDQRDRAESKERVIGGIRFDVPSDWEEKAPSSSMLMAEYRLSGDSGPGRLTFSTAGGGKDANVDRWKQQFHRGPNDAEPQETAIVLAGKNGTLIEVTGEFTDMFGGGAAKPDWQLLGVVVPIEADQNFFIKLTGPAKTLQSRKEEFMRFLQSARK